MGQAAPTAHPQAARAAPAQAPPRTAPEVAARIVGSLSSHAVGGSPALAVSCATSALRSPLGVRPRRRSCRSRLVRTSAASSAGLRPLAMRALEMHSDNLDSVAIVGTHCAAYKPKGQHPVLPVPRRLPLQLAPRACRCRARLDERGDHRSACATSGVLAARAPPLERAVARVCQEAGAHVVRNVRLANMNLDVPVHDERRIEVVAKGLPLWHGAQLAVDATIVSPVTPQVPPNVTRARARPSLAARRCWRGSWRPLRSRGRRLFAFAGAAPR